MFDDINHEYSIINGDCLLELPPIADKKFQLIVSSPPYNIGKSYEKKIQLQDYLIWQQEVISILFEKLADNGSIVWQIGNYIENGEVFPLDIYFYEIFKKLGLKLRNRIIWHFCHGLHATKRLSGRYETLLWFTKSDEYIFNLDNIRIPSKYPGKRHYKGNNIGQPSGNPLGKNPSDFWQIMNDEFAAGIIDIPNVKSNHPEKTQHPCQFPVELIERFILAMTMPYDWVLDPFGGVGSTLIAAIKNCRNAIMIEKEQLYCKIAKQRIDDFEHGKLKTRQIGTKIHEPTGREKISQMPVEWTKSKIKEILL